MQHGGGVKGSLESLWAGWWRIAIFERAMLESAAEIL
jgi:hypothetical protein